MADLNVPNRKLLIKRYEHQKMVALAQIQAREIRIMELEEETERCKHDIEGQKKVIVDMDTEIAKQKAELEKK